MSRLLYTVCIHRPLESTKSLISSSRTFFNARILFDEGKDDKVETKNQNTDEKATQSEDVDKKKKAQQKLQNLLELMVKKVPAENVPNVQLPRPRIAAQEKYRKTKAEYLERKKEIEDGRIGSKLEKAASEVARTLGGDTEKTEKELLELYLGRATARGENAVQDSDPANDGEANKTSMKDLLLSFEIEKPVPEEHQSRAHQLRNFKKDAKRVVIPKMPLSRSRSKVEKIDLFGSEPLNIFTVDEEGEKGPPVKSTMWDYLRARDLKLSVTHPPANIFEQLITWTEQGKIWKFPIDNEQDFEEKNVDFTEHVFLEHMLEPWCPSSGVIRHFMELVCVGLSKNPYLSVREKHAHIIFYEHYFKHKNDILVELGLEPIKDRPKAEERQEAAATA